MGHSNGGNGSVNRRRPLLRQGGTQAKLGVEVLKMTAIAVQELENAPPQSMPKTVRRKLASASKHMQLGISSVDKGTDALLRSSGLQYAVRKRVREVHDQGIGQNAACNLIKHLEECGEACADCTTMGGTDTSDSTTAITSAGDGRLRPFRVDGFEIPMPSNERWYQHREAVKLFHRRQKQGAKLKVVYDECARRDLMTVNYPCLMTKLNKVKAGVVWRKPLPPRCMRDFNLQLMARVGRSHDAGIHLRALVRRTMRACGRARLSFCSTCPATTSSCSATVGIAPREHETVSADLRWR